MSTFVKLFKNLTRKLIHHFHMKEHLRVAIEISNPFVFTQ